MSKQTNVQIDLSKARWFKASKSQTSNCVEVAFVEAGHVAVRDSKNPDGGTLVYTPSEWEAFLAGVRQGEFDRQAK